MIYVYTRGMHDYATPLQELLRLLRQALNTQEGGRLADGDQVLGYKLLVYISCCMAGHAYPSGEIAEGLAAAVRTTVFTVLVKKQLNEAEADGRVVLFPHLQTLLRCVEKLACVHGIVCLLHLVILEVFCRVVISLAPQAMTHCSLHICM